MENAFTGEKKTPAAVRSPAGDKVASITRDAWRELGFWYDCDVAGKRWTFRADRRGVAALAAEVQRFLESPESAITGEHTHLGPYSNLRFIAAERPQISWRGLAGRREDFARLAAELDAIAQASGDGVRTIGAGFEGADGFSAVIAVECDGFDPASAESAIEA